MAGDQPFGGVEGIESVEAAERKKWDKKDNQGNPENKLIFQLWGCPPNFVQIFEIFRKDIDMNFKGTICLVIVAKRNEE